MPILAARRSTSGLSSPEIRAILSPDLRASDSPMMSVNEKRFHSSPFGPHQNPPSVRTPSTSRAIALMPVISDAGSHAAQLLDDRRLPLENSLHAVAHGFFRRPDITHKLRDAVRLERSCLVRAPHGPVQRDMPFHHTHSHTYRDDARRQTRFMSGVS